MYVAQIIFNSLSSEVTEDQVDTLHSLLGSFRKNGNLLDTDFPMVQYPSSVHVFCLIPDSDAFEPRNYNQYVVRDIDKIKSCGWADPIFQVLGEDPSESACCRCRDSSGFILFTTYISNQSPVHCADCFDPVPLYRLPVFPSGDYYDLLGWQSDYKACDQLQMNCNTGERFAARQMADVNGNLSASGLEICRGIQNLTGKPSYYYLYRYAATSRAKELRRKCPKCEGEWLLSRQWHNFFDFKCDRCLLTSNISWNVR